jgi:hypothetical protein
MFIWDLCVFGEMNLRLHKVWFLIDRLMRICIRNVAAMGLADFPCRYAYHLDLYVVDILCFEYYKTLLHIILWMITTMVTARGDRDRDYKGTHDRALIKRGGPLDSVRARSLACELTV